MHLLFVQSLKIVDGRYRNKLVSSLHLLFFFIFLFLIYEFLVLIYEFNSLLWVQGLGLA